MTTELIVALDFHHEAEALTLVEKINPAHCALKVGNELFTLLGPSFVKKLVNQQFNVFLDLKFHDIPNTVARACAAAAEMGVWMMNLHASGGVAMMRAAKNALEAFGKDKPLLIAVTVLTSMNSLQLPEIGVDTSIANQVNRLAHLTHQAELDGVVCSALEAPIVKQLCGADFLTVTPGIRLPGDAADDQSRIVTPRDALMMGSDYLVMGRSITRSPNPDQVIADILASLAE
ncbi:orotidine-5'-phosphate decarboxylase [Legionella taurinensis]|uniref:orotidine-5'-phosphate decarboxylase n=1 Tax=Legionella taurinensis TaxID=70611 RepID=UPI00299E3F13|nr:orotidine-5'-phosphate decarboxylase [Legionella taurinensis]MDX1838251.1 orotidine-5'-phosphate decarboxylase [Legionella taurinensis]